MSRLSRSSSCSRLAGSVPKPSSPEPGNCTATRMPRSTSPAGLGPKNCSSGTEGNGFKSWVDSFTVSRGWTGSVVGERPPSSDRWSVFFRRRLSHRCAASRPRPDSPRTPTPLNTHWSQLTRSPCDDVCQPQMASCVLPRPVRARVAGRPLPALLRFAQESDQVLLVRNQGLHRSAEIRV